MPRLQYVCLSDLHFGEDDSLLTDLPTASVETGFANWTRVLEQLIACLKFVVQECGPSAQERKAGAPKPILILNGDTIEFAMCPVNKALMAFQPFLKAIIDADIFERIVVIPGNHDHHLWVLARETQFARYLNALKPGPRIDEPWYTTNLFVEHDPLPSELLGRLAKRNGCAKDAFVQIAYPNFGVLAEGGKKCAIFTHGHYIESAYHLMTRLKIRLFPGRPKPTIIWDVEAENGAWVEFFWSSFGSGKQVADSAEDFYEKCKDLHETIRMFANLLHEKSGADWLSDVKYAALDTVLAALIAPLVAYKWFSERWSDLRTVLGSPAEKGLREYVTAPLKNQILGEKHERPELGIRGFPDLTFAFGHTHKPFTKDKSYDTEFSGPVHVYNTGGWVVDTMSPDPYRGAAMLLLDENLDAAAIRLYNETLDERKYKIHVEKTPCRTAKPSVFVQRVFDAVHARGAEAAQAPAPWDDFADAVVEGLRERRKVLTRRINGGDSCADTPTDLPEVP
jgi:hypothetical protein